MPLSVTRDEFGFFVLNNTYGVQPNTRTVTLRLARDIEEAKKALKEQIKGWGVSDGEKSALQEAINEDMPVPKVTPLITNQSIKTVRALSSPDYPPISSSL